MGIPSPTSIDGNSVKSNEKSTKNVRRRYLPWMKTHTIYTYLLFILSIYQATFSYCTDHWLTKTETILRDFLCPLLVPDTPPSLLRNSAMVVVTWNHRLVMAAQVTQSGGGDNLSGR